MGGPAEKSPAGRGPAEAGRGAAQPAADELSGVLSMGLAMAGRRVVLVGGGRVAARRLRAFLDAGADVIVVAPRLDDLLTQQLDAITWVPRCFEPADLDGAWFVHTATGDPTVDATVAAACEQRRVWCVNASAASGGTASVPARAHVATASGPVQVAVTSGDPRRSVAVRAAIERHLTDAPDELRPVRGGGGRVALVGGGPGDAGLLTQRARVLLHAADVVVVDRLAPRAVLRELDPRITVIDVGKRPGQHPVPQREINALLVHHAQRGRFVVRLKGGDPYVFGRGGEERIACEQAGVPVEVVPGVTSAVAVPAAAGIPVTQRGVARAFSVVTGHDDIDDDIAALPVGADHTVVILMGVHGLARTAALLARYGRSPACPAAIIHNGWGADQRIVTAPLEELAAAAGEAGIGSPAVVVVGDVVRLSPHWHETVDAAHAAHHSIG